MFSSYDEKIRAILKKVSDGSLPDQPIEGFTQAEYFSMIEECHEEGYLKTTDKNIVSRTKTDIFLSEEILLTRNGYKFLNGIEDSPQGNKYIIGSVTSSNIGDNGTVNIEHGLSAAEVMEIVHKLVDASDKKEAEELIKTVEQEELKPGALKKFISLLEKYPSLVETVGRLVMTQLTS